MLSITGTYHNGVLHLDKQIFTEKPVNVVITFEEEAEKEKIELKLSDFSFLETQELLKDFKGSFSDEVISERRHEV